MKAIIDNCNGEDIFSFEEINWDFAEKENQCKQSYKTLMSIRNSGFSDHIKEAQFVPFH